MWSFNRLFWLSPSREAGAKPLAAVCGTGVMDRVLHPVEPFAVRLTLAGQF